MQWSVSPCLAESAGFVVATRLVRLGYYTRSNVATGILCIAFGVGLIGLGLSEGAAVGYIFVIAGLIELAAGIYYLRKPDAPTLV